MASHNLTCWEVVLDGLLARFRVLRFDMRGTGKSGWGSDAEFTYRRITALLHAQGWRVNHKRVERLWRQEGLRVPAKQPKRGRLWLADGSLMRRRAERPRHVWSVARSVPIGFARVVFTPDPDADRMRSIRRRISSTASARRPLAPDTDVPSGPVRIEPGDTPPPGVGTVVTTLVPRDTPCHPSSRQGGPRSPGRLRFRGSHAWTRQRRAGLGSAT